MYIIKELNIHLGTSSFWKSSAGSSHKYEFHNIRALSRGGIQKYPSLTIIRRYGFQVDFVSTTNLSHHFFNISLLSVGYSEASPDSIMKLKKLDGYTS